MATATVSTAISRSLLSRIGPSASEQLTVNAPAKRKISAEEHVRPTKKRSLSEEQHRVDQRTGFAPWLDLGESIDADASYEERLHDELVRFVDYISPSRQERKARVMLIARIEELLKARWPDARLILFGSSATGLELTGGDIDLVVDFCTTYRLTDVEKKRRLAAIGDVLRWSGMTTWVNRIFGARVPIVTFVTTDELGGISVDISIRNDEDAGPRAIPLIKQFLADLPALKPLILAVKAFLSLRDLNDASQSTLSSYAITLLCISFLQRNPARRPQKSLDEPLAEKSLGKLLMDFFRHYGHDFSYATHYISVSGRNIFLKAEKNWEPKANNPAVLAVQCMLNPESNITRGCGKISLIVQAFKEAYRVLEQTLLSNRKGATSLLCRIYEISEEDDARRHVLDNSVDSDSFAGYLDATTGDLGGRAVSGGVRLGPRSGYHTPTNNNRGDSRPLPRFAAGPTRGNGAPYASQVRRNNTNSYQPETQQTIQQLPVLRWQDNRNQNQSEMPLINTQFHFDSKSERFRSLQSSHTSSQARMPVLSNVLHQGHPRNYNNTPSGNFRNHINNHLASQQSQGAGRSYNVRH